MIYIEYSKHVTFFNFEYLTWTVFRRNISSYRYSWNMKNLWINKKNRWWDNKYFIEMWKLDEFKSILEIYDFNREIPFLRKYDEGWIKLKYQFDNENFDSMRKK